MERYQCAGCPKLFKSERAYWKHVHKTLHSFELPLVPISDSAMAKRIRYCEICEIDIIDAHTHKFTSAHKNRCLIEVSHPLYMISTAFKNRICSYRLMNDTSELFNTTKFLLLSRLRIHQLISKILKVDSAVKLILELSGEYELAGDGTVENKTFFIAARTIHLHDEFNAIFKEMSEEIAEKLDEFELNSSGWTLNAIKYVDLNINKYQPLRGSQHFELPDKIKHKLAVCNVLNTDNYCFAYSMLGGLGEGGDRPDRVASFGNNWRSLYHLGEFPYPMLFSNIPRFLELNPDISLNIYGVSIEDEVTGPIFHCKYKRANHVNLLYLQKSNRDHFCWIKDLSKLTCRQLSLNTGRVEICDGCLNKFDTEIALNDHIANGCVYVEAKVPEPETYLEFKNFNFKMEVPFVYYYDFECILQPIQHAQNNPNISETIVVSKHVPSSFGIRRHCSYDATLSVTKIYRGEDCAEQFVKWLMNDIRRVYNEYLKNIIPLNPLNNEEMMHFATTNTCHICSRVINTNSIKVIDHNHLNGKYRGPAHQKCNLNYKLPNHIPIIGHNASLYDKNLFFCELAKQNAREEIKVLPETKEKYITFSQKLTVGKTPKNARIQLEMRFLDSMRFLVGSLSSLVSALPKIHYKSLKEAFPEQKKFDLISRKGIFCYNYIKSFENYNERSLPSIEAFFNQLTQKPITLAEYLWAWKVYNVFKCKTLGEYSDLYLLCDVLLLTDLFEYFRKICMETYQIDPANTLTASNFSWNAMLKFTGVKIKLLDDIEQINFVKKSIRGGIVQASGRYGEANNPYMISEFDPTKPISYLMYYDANNLYGHSLSSYLPFDDYSWATGEWAQLDEAAVLQKLMSIPHNHNIGYILEVDLGYPHELHDWHNDFPFCAERIIPPNGRSRLEKLILNLNDKKKYVIHYRNLQQAIEYGLKLKKIYRVLKFHQSDWLKPFIDLNTGLRAATTISFEISLYKLFSNSIYGKVLQNVENYREVYIVNAWSVKGKGRDACRLIKQPNFHSLVIFNENLCAIELTVQKFSYSKPIQVGFTVLELSKHFMYDVYYGHFKAKYGANVIKRYLDTDGFIIQVYTRDVYADMIPDIDRIYDTSGYAPDNIFNIPLRNKKVLGMLKDELNGSIMTHYCGLRSKLYAYRLLSDEFICKTKGLARSARDELTWDDFELVLKTGQTIKKRMQRFRHLKNEITTLQINRVALEGSDDKRFIVPNSHTTLSWGHYAIPAIQAEMAFLEANQEGFDVDFE